MSPAPAFLSPLSIAKPNLFKSTSSQCRFCQLYHPYSTARRKARNMVMMSLYTSPPAPQRHDRYDQKGSSGEGVGKGNMKGDGSNRREMMDVEEAGLFGEVLRRAKERVRTGNIKGARDMFEDLVTRWRWEVRGWLEYGAFEESYEGDVEEAGKVYERGCRGCGGSGGRLVGELWIRWAKWEMGRGRANKAKEVLKEGCEILKGRSGGMMWVMWGGLEKGERARRIYESGVRCAGKDPCLWQAWACFEEGVGNVGRARQIFERGLVVDAGFASMWQGWALLEERQGNFDKARELFRRGVQADDTDAAIWQAWGRMEVKLGNCDQARSLFRDAADRVQGKGVGALYLSWGMLEVKSRNYPVARSVFQEGLRIEEETRRRRAMRGGNLRERGWKGMSKRRVEDYSRLLHAWGKMEVYTGNMDEARRLLNAAMLENPRDMHVVHALARIETQAGNHEDARMLLRRGNRLAPGDMYIVQALAEVEWRHFAREGGIERARQLYEDGIRAKPTDSGLIKGWAELEYVHGDRALSQRLRRLIRNR